MEKRAKKTVALTNLINKWQPDNRTTYLQLIGEG